MKAIRVGLTTYNIHTLRPDLNKLTFDDEVSKQLTECRVECIYIFSSCNEEREVSGFTNFHHDLSPYLSLLQKVQYFCYKMFSVSVPYISVLQVKQL
jgi:hypothetical protein